MPLKSIPALVQNKFEQFETHHAKAILQADFPSEWDDLMSMLAQFTLKRSHIMTPGGRKSPISDSINGFFYEREWQEHEFKIQVGSDSSR